MVTSWSLIQEVVGLNSVKTSRENSITTAVKSTVFSDWSSGVVDRRAVLYVHLYFLGVVGAALELGLVLSAADVVPWPLGDPLNASPVLLRVRAHLGEVVSTGYGTVDWCGRIHCKHESRYAVSTGPLARSHLIRPWGLLDSISTGLDWQPKFKDPF